MRACAALLLLCLVADAGWCQRPMSNLVPNHGQLQDSVYSNSYFGMRYSLPAAQSWFVNDDALQQEATRPGKPAGYFLLTVLDRHTGGALRERVAIAADETARYSPPLITPRGYVEKVTAALSKQGNRVLGKVVEVRINGRDFYRGNFREEDAEIYKALVATEARGFILSWTFAASSEAGLEQIVGTLAQLSIAPPQ